MELLHSCLSPPRARANDSRNKYLTRKTTPIHFQESFAVTKRPLSYTYTTYSVDLAPTALLGGEGFAYTLMKLLLMNEPTPGRDIPLRLYEYIY
jgi:hypothetical protein